MRSGLYCLVVASFALSSLAHAQDATKSPENNINQVVVTRYSLEPDDKSQVTLNNSEKGKDSPLTMNRHDFWINYFRKEEGGKLSFLSFFSASTKKQSLLIQKDYVHYRIEDKDNIGILIRLEANVETSDSSFEVKNFKDIGAAAQLGFARGNIHVKIHGLDGPEIYKMRLEVDLNSASLAQIEEQINILHNKIMTDPTLKISPVILPEEIFKLRDIGRGKV